jgi:hypothetical protein
VQRQQPGILGVWKGLTTVQRSLTLTEMSTMVSINA